MDDDWIDEDEPDLLREDMMNVLLSEDSDDSTSYTTPKSSARRKSDRVRGAFPWRLVPPPQPNRPEKPNKYRYQRPYKLPRVRSTPKRKAKPKKDEKFRLTDILFVPYLRKNPFVAQLMRVDGIPTVHEAAAMTVWTTIETALLILRYMEAKQNEMKALRAYTCQSVAEHFERSGVRDAERVEGCDCQVAEPLATPCIPLENSMFYDYQFRSPLFVWPYEKDFNIFIGLKAIDEYITLRQHWMKNMNYGILYDHCETDESSINHIYSIVGCNMRRAYPIGQATFNLVFIIISKYVAADPNQRVSVRFFIEGNPIEFIPMYNDYHLTERLVRHITNRKIRYFSKFHLTSSNLHKEQSTPEEMHFKKKLLRQYRKAIETHSHVRQKEYFSIPAYTALCGFCISYDGQCAAHKGKCNWDTLFTPEAAEKFPLQLERELNNTLKQPSADIFWPDFRVPMKTLFGRECLLW